MSSSDDAAFHDDDRNEGDEAAYTSSSGAGEEGSSAGDSSHDDDDNDDAIFISSRTEVVISPRRRVGASLWGRLEERMDAQQRSEAQQIAEQLRVGALSQRRRAAAAPSAGDGQRRSSKTKVQLTIPPVNSTSSTTTNTRASSSGSSKTRAVRTTTSKNRDGDDEAHVIAKRSSSRNVVTAQKEASTRGDDEGRKPQSATHRSSATRSVHKSSVTTSAPGSKLDDSRRDRGDVPSRQHEYDGELERKSHSSSGSSGGESDHHEESSRRTEFKRESIGNSGASASESSGEEEERAPQVAKRRRSKQSSAEKPSSRTNMSKKQQPRAQREEALMSPSSAASSISSSAYSQCSRPQMQKPASFLSDASAPDFSAVLPSPKEEMEELKQTLKKLASHDHNASSNMSESMAASSVPTSAPNGEYLRVATGLLPPSPADQLRLGEYVSSQPFANRLSDKRNGGNSSSFPKQRPSGTSGGKESRHASFDPAALSAKLHGRETSNSSNDNWPKSMTANGSHDEYQPTQPTRDDPRLSLNKKLFGQTANSPYDNPLSSHTNGSSGGGGMQGILGMSGGLGAASGAQGSRAVLSALKALQDKIRRLEEERETLMQQLSDEKVKARKVRFCLSSIHCLTIAVCVHRNLMPSLIATDLERSRARVVREEVFVRTGTDEGVSARRLRRDPQRARGTQRGAREGRRAPKVARERDQPRAGAAGHVLVEG